MSDSNGELNILKLYKNKPIVRCNDVIYYGYSSDRYIIKIQIVSSSKNFDDINLSSEVVAELLDLGPECKLPGTVLKTCTKSGLWNAIDVSSAWLERKLIS